jgi:hypothetical protein
VNLGLAADAVKVLVRLRPFSKNEKEEKEEEVWDINGEDEIKIKEKYRSYLYEEGLVGLGSNNVYTYDKCYDSGYTNSGIFEDEVKKHVEKSLTGINETIFMYG